MVQVGHVDKGGGWEAACREQGTDGKSLYLLFYFVVNPKLPPTIKSIKNIMKLLKILLPGLGRSIILEFGDIEERTFVIFRNFSCDSNDWKFYV